SIPRRSRRLLVLHPIAARTDSDTPYAGVRRGLPPRTLPATGRTFADGQYTPRDDDTARTLVFEVAAPSCGAAGVRHVSSDFGGGADHDVRRGNGRRRLAEDVRVQPVPLSLARVDLRTVRFVHRTQAPVARRTGGDH